VAYGYLLPGQMPWNRAKAPLRQLEHYAVKVEFNDELPSQISQEYTVVTAQVVAPGTAPLTSN
jgi:hypothetical protein